MRQPVLRALMILALASPAAAGTHVRVVLDTSKSMQTYDRNRLATLSTLLLYDLSLVNSTRDDSFEVLPFHPTQRWHRPSDPAPTGTGPRVRVNSKNRAALASSLASLPYDADWTYFYPGLRESVQDLEATSGGTSDARVIVLVTDGMPEEPTRAEEERLIREELAPRMEAASIRLYVLAFGPQAYPNRPFFESLVQGGRLGHTFFDQDGRGLLGSMIQIFSHGFGYLQETPKTLPVGSLDLAAGKAPDRVAVVLFRKDSKPPVLALRTPQGNAVNTADGVREGKEKRAGYQMAWVLSPKPGLHPIDDTAPGATVAVLRPMDIDLDVRSPRTGRRVDQVMAGMVPLEILVRPAAGGKGDPGEVDLTYQSHGPRAGGDFAWDGEIKAPPAGGSRPMPEGRMYPVLPKFPEPSDGQEFYIGHLEVMAKRGTRVLASLSGSRAHRVEVYPRISLSPTPALGDAVPEGAAAMRGLVRWERGCSRFKLELAAGGLPLPRYSLRAVLDASTPGGGGLEGASWTLDGLPLEVDGRPGEPPSLWAKGRELSTADLLGKHEVCIQAGKPKPGSSGRPFELFLKMTLLRSPYDDFDVIEPFVLKVLIAEPGFLERWGARSALALAALTLLAAFWYLRGHPDLPQDLRLSAGRAGSRTALAPRPLAEASLLSRLLGWVGERPVLSEAGDRLGFLRPFREGLYRFRPVRGARIETAECQPVDAQGDWAELSVHRVYRIRQGEKEFLLQVEYS